MKLDFEDYDCAQDMIALIKKEKGISDADAIQYAINHDIYNAIVNAGWASMALGLWGHDDFEREWNTLDNPCIEVDLDADKQKLIHDLAEKEDVDEMTAVCYFLLFTMDALGYHI